MSNISVSRNLPYKFRSYLYFLTTLQIQGRGYLILEATKFPKNLETASKFWAPEGWHELSSILRTHISRVTYEPHRYLAPSPRFDWHTHFCGWQLE